MSRLTDVVRAGIATDPAYGAVVPPIHMSANFVFPAPGQCGDYDYTRSGNPTRDVLADALCTAEGGTHAVVTSSGMAAVKVVTQLLRPGDVILAPHDLYGGSHRLFVAESRRVGFDVHFVDQSSEEAFELARRLKPTLIWLETPSNPLLRIVDLERWADVGRESGAWTVADNTFLSPAGQRPLSFGVDAVLHSTTKFINGHSDVVGGAVVTRDAALGEQLAWWTNCIGCAGAPLDAWLTLRGLRTLSARSAVHEANALALVHAVEGHPGLVGLHHPSRSEHPGHEIARRQQDAWGSLITLDIVGGRSAAYDFIRELSTFTLAESLGGVESLVSHPPTMTHASMTEDARRAAGIGEGLVRLSVGIEDGADLVEDVLTAMDHTHTRWRRAS